MEEKKRFSEEFSFFLDRIDRWCDENSPDMSSKARTDFAVELLKKNIARIADNLTTGQITSIIEALKEWQDR